MSVLVVVTKNTSSKKAGKVKNTERQKVRFVTVRGPMEALVGQWKPLGTNYTTMYQTMPLKASDGPEMAMGASVSVKKTSTT